MVPKDGSTQIGKVTLEDGNVVDIMYRPLVFRKYNGLLFEVGKENTVWPGQYKVGEDIPAGSYTITNETNSTAQFHVYKVAYKDYSNNGLLASEVLVPKDGSTQIGKVTLEDGNVVDIMYEKLTFQPYKGIAFDSFGVEEGESEVVNEILPTVKPIPESTSTPEPTPTLTPEPTSTPIPTPKPTATPILEPTGVPTPEANAKASPETMAVSALQTSATQTTSTKTESISNQDASTKSKTGISEEPEKEPEVTVPPYIAPADADRALTFTETKYVIKEKGQLRLTPEINRLSEEAPKKSTLIWSSSNEQIAVVNAQGSVKGMAPGYAIISCSLKERLDVQAHAVIQIIRPVKAMKVEEQNMILVLGGSESAARGKIKVQITPEDATFRTCSFTSSDERIIQVDENGNVQAVSAGKAKITIIPNEKGSKVKAVCNITVGKAVSRIIGISANQTIAINKTLTLKPTVIPKDALSTKVTYTSSNERIATVSKTGTVKALKPGTVTITCTAADGSGVSSSCNLTVISPVTKLSTNTRRVTITKGNTKKWYVSTEPSNATNRKLQYSSADNSIARVDETGTITASRAGRTKITAITTDGSKKSITCDVIVESDVPITLDSIGHGVFQYNLLGLTVKNETSTQTIVDFNFDMTMYNYNGTVINEGSYSLGKEERIGPKQKKTIKRNVYGSGQAYKTVITITSVKFSDGTYYYIPSSKQQTWSFTRN